MGGFFYFLWQTWYNTTNMYPCPPGRNRKKETAMIDIEKLQDILAEYKEISPALASGKV